MATTIPDLWPDTIEVHVLPPIAILRVQESILARKTQGWLQAQLSSTEADRLVQHQLDLIAPELDFYRERILTATHDREKVYPVTVRAECFAPKRGYRTSSASTTGSGPPPDQREVNTPDEFIEVVRQVLHSGAVVSLLSSLLARINERRNASQHAGEGGTEGGSPPTAPTGNGADEE